MSSLKDLQNIAKDLIVLYVEDQDEIRTFTSSILSNFFKKVVTASNGQNGLNCFKKDKFDLVITDIQMPKMTGLEMIKELKKIDKFIPVVITTAFNDEDYFLDSIELGVDRYVIKPLEPKKLSKALYEVALSINNKKKAKEYEQKLIQERINITTTNIIDKVANSFPIACIVYTGDEIRFINTTFNEIFSKSQLEKLINKEKSINDFFKKKEGYLSSLDDYNNEINNLVIIEKDNQNRIFRINLKEVNLDVNGELSKIYSFSDITLLEYQKNKIKNSNELLKDVLFTKFKKNRQVTQPIINLKDNPKNILILNEEEKNILRKSHRHKLNANEYIANINEDILCELSEMKELEDKLKNELNNNNSNFQNIIINISEIILKYSITIKSLVTFEDLAYALNSLSNILNDLIYINDKKKKKILLLLDGITTDLVSWRNSIFIDKSAIDIHYLDSSLFSSCVQLELELSDSHISDNDEDILELF